MRVDATVVAVASSTSGLRDVHGPSRDERVGRLGGQGQPRDHGRHHHKWQRVRIRISFMNVGTPPSLPDTDLPSCRRLEFHRIITNAGLEHDFNLLDVLDAGRWVTSDDSDVRALAGDERTDAVVLPEESRAVRGRDGDRLERRQSRFDEQSQLPDCRVSGDHSVQDTVRPASMRVAPAGTTVDADDPI